jgi:hypothetical protein
VKRRHSTVAKEAPAARGCGAREPGVGNATQRVSQGAKSAATSRTLQRKQRRRAEVDARSLWPKNKRKTYLDRAPYDFFAMFLKHSSASSERRLTA